MFALAWYIVGRVLTKCWKKKKRYGRGFTKDFGFAVVNGITKPGAYIVKYDAYSFDQIKMFKVGNKPITAFAISQDGAVLAFASADLSITLLDALSFRVSYY